MALGMKLAQPQVVWQSQTFRLVAHVNLHSPNDPVYTLEHRVNDSLGSPSWVQEGSFRDGSVPLRFRLTR